MDLGAQPGYSSWSKVHHAQYLRCPYQIFPSSYIMPTGENDNSQVDAHSSPNTNNLKRSDQSSPKRRSAMRRHGGRWRQTGSSGSTTVSESTFSLPASPRSVDSQQTLGANDRSYPVGGYPQVGPILVPNLGKGKSAFSLPTSSFELSSQYKASDADCLPSPINETSAFSYDSDTDKDPDTEDDDGKNRRGKETKEWIVKRWQKWTRHGIRRSKKASRTGDETPIRTSSSD